MADLAVRRSHPLGSNGDVCSLAQRFLMELVWLPACCQARNPAILPAGLPVFLIRNRPFTLCLIMSFIMRYTEAGELALKFKSRMEDIRNMKQNDIAFLGLGVKFPALLNAPGVSPWNPNQLDIWAAESASDNNAVHAARFLLNLWMPAREWRRPPASPCPR